MHEEHMKAIKKRAERVGSKVFTFTITDFLYSKGRQHRYVVKCDCGAVTTLPCISLERALRKKSTPCEQCKELQSLYDKKDNLSKILAETNKQLDNIEYEIIALTVPEAQR